MKLFLKDNKGYLFIWFFTLIITLSYCYLKDYMPISEILYLIILNTAIALCFLAYRYYNGKELYKFLSLEPEKLQDINKDLGSSLIGKHTSSLLQKIYTLYEGEVQKHNKSQKERLTFINQWIHQMKTPLSIMTLQLEEYAGDPLAEALSEEACKLDKGLNLALNYSRMDFFEKDFIIEKLNLQELVLETVNHEKKLFIKNKILPSVEISEKLLIYSDRKWLQFVLEQLITNGIKYSRGIGKKLILAAKAYEDRIILEIVDQGIGIPASDIKRVFEPFFTGENGRTFGESTGMGLYLVKSISDSLGHHVDIKSQINKGTTVFLVFDISNLTPV